MLIDSHCHIDYFSKQEQDNVIKRAKESGVDIMQTICTKITEFDSVLAIANSNKNVFCSVGVHPDSVHEEPRIYSAKEISSLCEQNKKVIGIGETGLDYYRSIEHKDKQQESFLQHIKAALQTQLPIIVHSRSAEEDTQNMLTSNSGLRGLIHCFTGSEAFAMSMIDFGFYISISGIVTFKNSHALQSIVQKIPLNRLIIETDSPFLAPTPYRGKKNEPSFVRHVAEFIAKLKNVDFEVVSAETTKNFFTLFSKTQVEI